MRLHFFASAGLVLLSLSSSWAIRPKVTSVPGEVVVQAYPGIDLASRVRTKAAKSVNDATPSPFFEGISLSAPITDPQAKAVSGTRAAARDVKGLPGLSLPGVLRAEPNYIGSLAYVPSDPLYLQTSDHFTRIWMEGYANNKSS